MENDENPVSVRPFGFRAPRVPANFSFSLEVIATGERYEAVCTDISEDGLAAELLQPLAPKTTVTIRMLLPGGIAPLHLPGSVEYSQDGHCGVNFLDSSSEDRRQIQQFIQSIA